MGEEPRLPTPWGRAASTNVETKINVLLTTGGEDLSRMHLRGTIRRSVIHEPFDETVRERPGGRGTLPGRATFQSAAGRRPSDDARRLEGAPRARLRGGRGGHGGPRAPRDGAAVAAGPRHHRHLAAGPGWPGSHAPPRVRTRRPRADPEQPHRVFLGAGGVLCGRLRLPDQ